jgi:hypothetical protein
MESAEIEGADIDYNALYSLETRTVGDTTATSVNTVGFSTQKIGSRVHCSSSRT